MNYLAHLFLSCEDEELMIGNFIADFVKNHYREELSPRVLEGIQLHRIIDSFTDRHPAVVQATRLLHPKHHKYSPVLMDVFFDYLLVENWEVYGQESLEDFSTRVYAILSKNIDLIPEPFQARTLNMVQHRWLMSYMTLAGMEDTFERMKKRVSKPEYFEEAVVSLQEHHEELTATFHTFFPEIIGVVQRNCFC
ncbi:MAG: ACP phosphodiesterase [Bacteroidota bacterium]